VTLGTARRCGDFKPLYKDPALETDLTYPASHGSLAWSFATPEMSVDQRRVDRVVRSFIRYDFYDKKNRIKTAVWNLEHDSLSFRKRANCC
jgi:hypothetical protein